MSSSALCNPFARSAGIFQFSSKFGRKTTKFTRKIAKFVKFYRNIPALRAKGLHNPELDTRARSALVIKKENYNTLLNPVVSFSVLEIAS